MNPLERAANRKRHFKRWYENRKLRGICTRCAEVLPEAALQEGRTTCAECRRVGRIKGRIKGRNAQAVPNGERDAPQKR